MHVSISKTGCQKDSARFFPATPSDRTQRHKLNHRKFHLTMRKNFTLAVA